MIDYMKKKSILICISTNLGISKLIHDNLRHHNFDVTLLIENNGEIEKFKYPSIFSRLKVKFQKLFLRDKLAKKKLESNILKKRLIKNKIDKFDYSLFFLAHNFSIDLVSYIKNRTSDNGMINFQWDGMSRYPSIYDYVKLFDRFYVFDPKDVKNDFLPATNFYFDHNLNHLHFEYDFYFLGAHNAYRKKIIIDFANFAKKRHWNINIIIISQKIKNIYPSNITELEIQEAISFSDNLTLSKKAKVLLDFVIDEHKGLSFRAFEALGYNKKLITTNKEITKYDFYHPNNIFILDNNFDEIPDFLEKPYQDIDPKIKEKYSFGNWIKYVLDIHPHQPILLPLDNHEENKTVS
ncbi:Uncharacterised protein [Actinobacillus indolicus]|nr:Uncharacterised protein [Actinobacillus indolicus]VTU08129.1 Uncharacterised protein [Actinobacillus indolicus]